MKLTEVSGQFEGMGIKVATITYDSVELLKNVALDQDINFPLLHDEAVKHVNSVGIRNLDYEPGHRFYGIPYPGMFLISPDSVIRYKFAEQDYRQRPDFAIVLEAAARI